MGILISITSIKNWHSLFLIIYQLPTASQLGVGPQEHLHDPSWDIWLNKLPFTNRSLGLVTSEKDRKWVPDVILVSHFFPKVTLLLSKQCRSPEDRSAVYD